MPVWDQFEITSMITHWIVWHEVQSLINNYCISGIQYLQKSLNWIPVIGHLRDGAPVTWQISECGEPTRFKNSLIDTITCLILQNQVQLLVNYINKRGRWGFAVLRYWCFFNAVMQWIKSQLAVWQWSQTLQCAIFVFFMLRCSAKWNCLRCWGYWFTFFKPKFDVNLACKLR